MSPVTQGFWELIKYLLAFDYSKINLFQIALYSSIALNIFLGLNLLITKNYRFRCFVSSIKNIFIKPKTAEEMDRELEAQYENYYKEFEVPMMIENNGGQINGK